MLLDKKSLLNLMEIKTQTVTLGKDKITLTELSHTAYQSVFESKFAKDENGKFDGEKFVAVLVTHCIIDKKGNRILSDEDSVTLRAGAAGRYLKLAAAAKKLNGMGDDEEKNSEADLTDSSHSSTV